MSENSGSRLKQLSVAFLCAIATGLLAVVFPTWVLPLKQYESVLFPTIRTGIEGMGYLTWILLLLGGAVLGFAFRRPVLTGIATMIPFPVLAMAEMIVDPTSHKLWPIEFVIYAAVSLLAVVGGVGGYWIGKALRSRSEPPARQS
jgi:hypothetical protein